MSAWNKRSREHGEGDSWHNGQQRPRIHYSDLAPEVKLQKRRQERQEKKERDRTLSYFKSVQRALDEHAAGANDASALASIVDGFFVELIRLLKADPTLHLLRNAVVCRVVESALANSLLLHGKSLLYVLLGHVFDTITSPTASYVVETLVASLAQALDALADDAAEEFDAEMVDGGPGIHVGSGVPSTATLIAHVAEELSERADEIIFHEVAARAARSVVLVLGGLTIRGAPPLKHVVKFAQPLSTLGVALMRALQSTFSDRGAERATDPWLAIVNTPTASFVLQSLLRVCEPGTEVDAAVRQQLESVCDDDGTPLLRRFLMDPLGCHIFQAYIKVPLPSTLLELCDPTVNRKTAEAAGAVEQTCWDKAYGVVTEALDELIDPEAKHTTAVVYVLQDLVLFAPTLAHLKRVWGQLLEPRLRAFVSFPSLAPVLAVFARKCAFGALCGLLADVNYGNSTGNEKSLGAGGDCGGTDSIPVDIKRLLCADVAQGARYFYVPTDFQRTVATSVCSTIRSMCARGAVQYLLVDCVLGDKGFELARYILCFHTSAAMTLAHTMDKIRLEDLVVLLRHAKGSPVLQQYLRATAAEQLLHRADTKNCEKLRVDRSASARLLRRVSPLLPELVGDTYAAFVLEVLYEVGSLGVKEEFVKLLVPIYTGLRHGSGDVSGANFNEKEEGEEGNTGTAGCPRMREFIARKVMKKCCVELYIHRPDDWAKLARRQCQVLRLLQRMSAISS